MTNLFVPIHSPRFVTISICCMTLRLVEQGLGKLIEFRSSGLASKITTWHSSFSVTATTPVHRGTPAARARWRTA